MRPTYICSVLGRVAFYIFILPVSILPFGALYAYSNFLRFWVEKVFRYRRSVILENLENSFPEKSKAEIENIASDFYKHFCDLIVEGAKLFSISRTQVEDRVKAINPEVIEPFYKNNRSVILVGGHYSNWEWYAGAANLHVPHRTYAIYFPLKNKFFDKKMKKAREKFGLNMVAWRLLPNVFKQSKENPTAVIFAADQSPSNEHKCYWMEFLNQDTGVLLGTEMFARKYNIPVIYGELRKVKRGYYEVEYEVLFENPSDTTHGEVTEKHSRALESTIKKQPAYWLWSHKRWKKNRPKNHDGTR